MCKINSSLSSSSHFHDHLPAYPNSVSSKMEEEEEDEQTTTLSSSLIPKHPTAEKQPKQTQEKTSTTHLSLAINEAFCILEIAFPMILTGLLIYSRSMISMLFLGQLGELALAGGSLAVGFANITGYSILSGLAMGMEPICGQAFGAKKLTLLGLYLQRTVILLSFSAIPISFLWLNMKKILVFFGQDEDIAIEAQSYLLFCLPDLLAQSFLHPLRIYLRTQSITLPLTFCAAFSIFLHIPINYILVFHLNLGIKGVALSGVLTNFFLVSSLILYIIFSGNHQKTWEGISMAESLKEWRNLIDLAIPSCVSVCLEWWWYEIMILLCGLFINPKATVASMGILIQTTALIYVFPSSLSFSVSTRVGNELGANRPEKAKRSAIVGLSLSFILGFSALIFTVLTRKIWATIFTDDKEIIALTSLVLPIIGLCEIGNCPQTTGCGVLRGTARPKIGANINLVCFYFVGMPVAMALGFYCGFDFEGLWLGLLAAQGSCAVTMVLVLARTDWKGEAERAKTLTASEGNHSLEEEDEEKQFLEGKRNYSLEEDEEKQFLEGEINGDC